MKHRKSWKYIVVLTGLLLLAVMAAPRIFRVRNEAKITEFVIENRTELEKLVFDYYSGNHIEEHYQGIDIDGISKEVVQFNYSSFGIAPSGKYYGFYHSIDGLPRAFQSYENPLVSISYDEWEWTDGTDNGGITKRIVGNWFYYEAWF